MKTKLADKYWPLTILLQALFFVLCGVFVSEFRFVFWPLAYGWCWLAVLFRVVSRKKIKNKQGEK